MWLNVFIGLCVYAVFVMAPYILALPLQNPETNKTASTTRNIVFNENDRSDEIIFPDDSNEDIIQLIPRLGAAPKCAKGTTYCEKLESYPRRYVKEILRNAHGYDLFFGEDDTEEDLVERNSNSEKFVCASISRVIYPQGAKNTKDEWKFIVNQIDEGYVQGIKVEECARPNRPCDIMGSIPDGIEMSCKQKYVYRRLLAISELGSPTVDTFLFPSACCCSYRRNYAMFLRSLKAH